MNQEQNLALILRIREGDADALDQLIEANRGLVGHAVGLLARFGQEAQDLYQAGCEALVWACQDGSYDETRASFSTFATWQIRRAIRKAKEESLLIQVGRDSTRYRALKGLLPPSHPASIAVSQPLFLDAQRQGEELRDVLRDSAPSPEDQAIQAEDAAELQEDVAEAFSYLTEPERLAAARIARNGSVNSSVPIEVQTAKKLAGLLARHRNRVPV